MYAQKHHPGIILRRENESATFEYQQITDLLFSIHTDNDRITAMKPKTTPRWFLLIFVNVACELIWN